MIDYLVGEIGQKLSVRTAPEKGYIRRTTIRVPMDPEDFNDLLSGLSRGRRRFDVTAEDLDNLLPDGWSERAFRTTNRCVVSRQQPIIIRFADQRKLHYDHSKCPRCGLHQKGCRNPCTVIIAQQSIFFTKVWTIHKSTFYGINSSLPQLERSFNTRGTARFTIRSILHQRVDPGSPTSPINLVV